MTNAIFVGHGEHDGQGEIRVPDDIAQVDFFADPDKPGLLTNMIALLAQGNLGIPLDSAVRGGPIANYTLKRYTDAEIALVLSMNDVQEPVYVVGDQELSTDAIRLCETPDVCPEEGPHQCDGIFGLAAGFNFTHIQLLSCRTNTTTWPEPTEHLMNAAGDRDNSLYKEFEEWVHNFLGLSPKDQDAAWAELPHATKVYLSADLGMHEFARAYEARVEIARSPDQAAVLMSLDSASMARILRDHPTYRSLLTNAVTLEPQEAAWIENDFLPLRFDEKRPIWRSLTEEHRKRYLTHPEVALWDEIHNAWEQFERDLPRQQLAAWVARLRPRRQGMAGTPTTSARLPQRISHRIHMIGAARSGVRTRRSVRSGQDYPAQFDRAGQ